MASVNVMFDLGGSFAYLLRTGPRARVGLARGRGTANGSIGTAVAWLVIEGGEGELVVGALASPVGGRDDVFDGPGWSAVLGPKTRFAVRGNIRYAISWRKWDQRPVETRVIPPDQVAEETRGSGPNERLVRTYLPEGPLICGEALVRPGRWSSWPPHRHEHEEAYLYRFDPEAGFGIHVLDTAKGGRRAEVVQDGDVRRVRLGHHAVVTSPASTMCYLWALAGEAETVVRELDSRYAEEGGT